MINQDQARKILKEVFPFTEKCTQYLACYKTKSGKEIALEREREDAFYIWLQNYDAEIDGVVIRNEKFPGQPYERKQRRNSNLESNAPNLWVGNRAWYLRIESIEALKQLINWYSGI